MSIFRRVDILYTIIEATIPQRLLRIFARIIVVNMIASFIVVNYYLPPLELSLVEIGSWREVVIILWSLFTVFGTLIWWLYLFWHLAKNDFLNNLYKPIWLVILIIGTILFMLGPIFYYIYVVEFGKGFKVRKINKEL